jgi:hypothetical protein
MTVYITSEDGQSIVSKVKTGLNSFKDIKLPISESSLAGFCALNKRHMNIRDVYDDSELKQYSANLTFLKAVDQRTGYRSKQMLIAPILNAEAGDLMGVTTSSPPASSSSRPRPRAARTRTSRTCSSRSSR